tara:strand:- start:3131 stop:3331 length:201 start_codon:yes stop_codon:yes gene_type:complete
MSVAKIVEISSSSKDSFEDAIRSGIRKISKTVKHVQGAWIKEQKVVIDDGEIVEFRVSMQVTFIVK